MIFRTSATHLSMHNNGYVKNQPQQRHLENFVGLLPVCTVGTRNCSTTRKSATLSMIYQRHVIVEELLELVAA